MCQFFSFCQDQEGNIYHLHPDLFPETETGAVQVFHTPTPIDYDGYLDPDSHTAISVLFNLSEERDGCAKYEMSIPGKFRVDYAPTWLTEWHQQTAEQYVQSLGLNTPMRFIERVLQYPKLALRIDRNTLWQMLYDFRYEQDEQGRTRHLAIPTEFKRLVLDEGLCLFVNTQSQEYVKHFLRTWRYEELVDHLNSQSLRSRRARKRMALLLMLLQDHLVGEIAQGTAIPRPRLGVRKIAVEVLSDKWVLHRVVQRARNQSIAERATERLAFFSDYIRVVSCS